MLRRRCWTHGLSGVVFLTNMVGAISKPSPPSHFSDNWFACTFKLNSGCYFAGIQFECTCEPVVRKMEATV